MGVKDLWQLLSPVGRRVNIESLQGKTLAIDMSVWLTQFIKAMRDNEGKMIKNAHLIGTLRRILKLLYNHIRPLFVFDGATPALKAKTLQARRQKRFLAEEGKTVSTQRLLLQVLKRNLLLEKTNAVAVASAAAKSKVKAEGEGDEEDEMGTGGAFVVGFRASSSSSSSLSAGNPSRSSSSSSSSNSNPIVDTTNSYNGRECNGDNGDDDDDTDWVDALEVVGSKSLNSSNRSRSSRGDDADEEEYGYSGYPVSSSSYSAMLASAQTAGHNASAADFDVEVMASLNVLDRKTLAEHFKRQLRSKNRSEYMNVRTNAEMYSLTQMSHFKRSIELTKKLHEVQALVDQGHVQEGKQGGQGIDGDGNRKYIMLSAAAAAAAAAAKKKMIMEREEGEGLTKSGYARDGFVVEDGYDDDDAEQEWQEEGIRHEQGQGQEKEGESEGEGDKKRKVVFEVE